MNLQNNETVLRNVLIKRKMCFEKYDCNFSHVYPRSPVSIYGLGLPYFASHHGQYVVHFGAKFAKAKDWKFLA